MLRKPITRKKTTTVLCSDNGKNIAAEVISFIPNQRLIVSIEPSSKMEMIYNSNRDLYMSNQFGLEFVSNGPGTTNVI
jgi:hypothetical protein